MAQPADLSLSGGSLAVFEHALDAMFIVDDARCIIETNTAGCVLLGLPRDVLTGRCLDEFFLPLPEYGMANLEPRWQEFLRVGSRRDECLIRQRDGAPSLRIAFSARANVLPGRHLTVAHDVTAWRHAEDAIRHAEQFYRTLVETTGTGYLVVDPCGCVLDANAEYLHLSGHASLDDIQGRHPLEWTVPADRMRLAAEITRCLDGQPVRDLEITFCDTQGRPRPVEINATALPTAQGMQVLCLCHDITARVQTRHELEQAHHELEGRVAGRTAELARANLKIQSRARQQESVADLGRRALAGAQLDELIREAVETVGTVLGVDYSGIVEHADPESDQLLLRAGYGGGTEQFLDQPIATTDPAFLSGFALGSPVPVVFEDLASETRFRLSPALEHCGIVSGMAAHIGGNPQPFGLIAAHSCRPRHFSPDDIYFLQSIANVLAAAIERKRSEEIVRLAQQAAVSANNAKIEFLSRMSHELRTPLNAILGFSQLLEIERLDPGQRESVEQITRAGRHLLELVNEVLDISRIDSGNMSLTPEPLAVDELACEALDLIRPLASARNIELLLGPAAREPGHYVLVDRQRLRQVLLNLLSNAVKYNREGGRVTLDAGPTPDGKRLRLSVRDTGYGIAPENLPLLFTPFERLGAENTNVEGSGIGLTLAKRLVESQGGDLGVESELDVGTTFWIDLPVAAAPAADSAPVRLEELFGDSFFPLEEEEASGSMTGDACAAGSEPPPRTVLHIEDNEPNRRLVEMLILQRPAWRLLTAARGGEGLALAREHRPDLILLDMHLPDMRGDEVLSELRRDEVTSPTPVVMVSADAAAMRRNQELAPPGADYYLSKPFSVSQFLKLLDRYLVRDVA